MTTDTLTAADVEAAAERLAGVVDQTPLQLNARLSALSGARVYLKREDLQPVRSFKLRGAYNLISQLSDSERAAGVVCASAGNHGQGVAYACHALGIRGQIFVPSTTPRQKRDRMLALGGDMVDLVVVGDTYDDAATAAAARVAATGATLVPAFDDLRTMAGQGTLAIEVVEQLGHAPDVLVVGVGGGGLLAGCVSWLGERHPGTRVVGVEPAGAACLGAALAAGELVDLPEIDTFVDGAAVRRAGAHTYPIVKESGAELISVPEGRICSEMLALYQVDGVIAEPAGALASSALGRFVHVQPGQDVVVVVSGGNNDVSRYSEIVERALVYEGRKHYFLVNFPQEPGALRRFLDEVLGPDDDITLFEYVKRSNRETGPALVGVELGDPGELDALLDRMAHSPMGVEKVEADSPFYRFLV
ncbi:threonine ammonia-lyase IlvA [Arsenicicoccus piscis]|uniref:L-threonine dehydratase n=1 Tax=Arsenicicoccus piscis TaxID=673954 RepID=A0ABQ6HRL4_9MICO|nr:threonine ammonia-lyase IlvA [Arsenicicoccus piscis]MCH8626221.1 threonine ammonia-lyase IlvA [Arsenicicoccus piscis]GMA20812.1 L-threonine dehydratase [Arsenicicoccus piscis]